eukprot:2844330-Pyramimonas_sp.AAC.1
MRLCRNECCRAPTCHREELEHLGRRAMFWCAVILRGVKSVATRDGGAEGKPMMRGNRNALARGVVDSKDNCAGV